MMSQTVAFASYQFMVIKTIQMLKLICLSLSGVFCLIFIRKKWSWNGNHTTPFPCCMNVKSLASVSVGILLLYKEEEILAKLVKAPFMSR